MSNGLDVGDVAVALTEWTSLSTIDSGLAFRKAGEIPT